MTLPIESIPKESERPCDSVGSKSDFGKEAVSYPFAAIPTSDTSLALLSASRPNIRQFCCQQHSKMAECVSGSASRGRFGIELGSTVGTMAHKRDRWELPQGSQYALQLVTMDEDVVRSGAEAHGEVDLFEAAFAMHGAEPVPAFLHSALCAMSLPTRRPRGGDEFKPIIRQDRNYSLAITPKPRLVKGSDGKATLVNLGVPFGAYPRVALISILTQAVRQQSRDIYLGGSFRDMMKRFGYEGASRGKRGQTDLFKEQLDRLLACEWMIHWEDDNVSTKENAFNVSEVKLSHDYGGVNGPDGALSRELRLSESFYEHLRQHAVRFDMSAIHALRAKPTAIDLYTYLAYRLPRIGKGKSVELDYVQLAAHMGNQIENVTKLRQTIRRTLDVVSSVYKDARIEIGDRKVRLSQSPPPVPDAIKVVSAGIPKMSGKSVKSDRPSTQMQLVGADQLTFPEGNIRYGPHSEPLRQIIRRHTTADIQNVAEAYRSFMKSISEPLPVGDALIRSFEGFCKKYRRNAD